MAKTLWSRNGQENDNSENGGGSSKLGPQGQERSPSSAQESMMALRPSKSGLFSRIKGIGRQTDSSQGQGKNDSPGSSAFSSSTPTPRPRPTQTTAEKRRAEALKANGLLPASRRYSALLPPNVVWTEPKADTDGGKGGMSAADFVKREWEARTVGERDGGGSALAEREAEDRNVNANVDEPRPPPRTPGKPKKKPDLAIAVLPDRPSPGTKGRVSGTHSPKAVFNSWKFPSSPNLNTTNLGTPTFLQTITAASPISAPGSDTDEEEEDGGSDDDSGTHDALLSPRFIPLPRSPGRSPKESRFLFAPPSPSLIPLPASPHPSQSYFDGHSRGQVIPLTPNLIPLPASPLPSQSYFDNSGTSCPPTPRHIPLPISRAPTPSPIQSPLPSPRLAPQKPIPSFPLPPVPPSPRFVPLPTSPSPNALAFSASTSHGSPPVSEKVSQWLTRSPTGATASRESLVQPRAATASTFPLTPVSPVVRSWSNSTTTTTATTSTADVPPPPPLSPSASSSVSPSTGATDFHTPPSAALSAPPTLPPSAHIKDTRSANNPNRIHHKAHLSQSSTTSTSSTSSNVLSPERAFLLTDRDQDLDISDLTLELPPVPIFPAARAEEENRGRSSSPLSFGSFSKRRTTMMAGTVTASTPREPRKSINLFGRRKATNETPPSIYTGKSPIGTDESSTRGSTNGNGSINKRKSILPSFARSKSSTMPNPNLSALQSPPLPASPASGVSFATGSSSTGHGHGHGRSAKQEHGGKEKSSNAKRMPLSPTMHSRATIMAQAGRIEDDDTRRLTEMAFLS